MLPMRIGRQSRSYRLRTTPMRDSEGRLLGTVTTLEDVTTLQDTDRFNLSSSRLPAKSSATRSSSSAVASTLSSTASRASFSLSRPSSSSKPEMNPKNSTT